MLDLGIIDSMTKPPTTKLVVEWMMKVYIIISIKVVINSWKHGAYTWFDHS